MISPVSGGATAYTQTVQPTKPQAAPSSTASSSSGHDTVELSSQSKTSSSDNGATYSRPITASVHSSKAGAAS